MGKRGRPALPVTSTAIPPKPKEGLSECEREAAAFRRMRELNNLASRRWRRRLNEEAAQRNAQLETLIIKNTELKSKLAEIEEKLADMNKKFPEQESGNDIEKSVDLVKMEVEENPMDVENITI